MAMFEYIAVFVAIFFFIFINIWRRNRDEIIQNWPIIGMLPTILRSLPNFHDHMTLILKHHGGTFRFEGPWFSNMDFIITSDPMNVHHITSKNFRNYGKGSNFHEIFEVFGGGIFNTDFHEWKQERTILHSLLKRKSFATLLQQSIQKKLENCLLPFLDHASKAGAQVDLQDIFERFTFDSNCTILFGFDPNCLPHKFTELSEIAYEKALPVIEEVIVYRHIIPRCLWKLQKWLQIGQEKKFKVAQESIDRFLHVQISRCNNIEEVGESHSDIVKMLLMEGAIRKGEMGDKYVRDIIFNLLAAGNGTISVCLTWFFWLVSTHPLVEAKIIQEIKDNWITSSLEELDKLVYLHGAICEVLRLFPPAPFEHVCAIKSDILPSGDRVAPNTKISYFLYSMGRMEQIWGEDCMEFKPERWISERGHIKHVPSYKFIAFNAGPRSCLGKNISFFQMKLVAASILWQFRIQMVEGHPVIPRVSALLTMKHGLKVKVTKRYISSMADPEIFIRGDMK